MTTTTILSRRESSPEATWADSEPGCKIETAHGGPAQAGWVLDKHNDPWKRQHDRECRMCRKAGEMRLICEGLSFLHLTDEPWGFVRPCERKVLKKSGRDHIGDVLMTGTHARLQMHKAAKASTGRHGPPRGGGGRICKQKEGDKVAKPLATRVDKPAQAGKSRKGGVGKAYQQKNGEDTALKKDAKASRGSRGRRGGAKRSGRGNGTGVAGDAKMAGA